MDATESDVDRARSRSVLIVDDSRLQRKILSSLLSRWGFETWEAESAEAGLAICMSASPDFVISDWMMPGMTGPDFCKAFRQLERESYGYFLLLTSKSEKAEIALGLDAGADDFLTKPVSSEELRARLTAGERILRMQEELVAKNRLVTETLDKMNALYDSVDRDLQEARKLQQSLVKERYRSFGASDLSLLLRPSGHVGGDLVGFFPISARRVALFAIDVSGHGIASALMTARLAGYLSSSSPDQNVALIEGEFGIYDSYPPDQVAKILNHLTLTEMETENYFTMVFADLDLVSGEVQMVQAGHPHPLIHRANGEIEHVGAGGPPIGLIPEMDYDTFTVRLSAGDRLCIVSDGVTECPNADGELLDDAGTADLLRRNRDVKGTAFMEALTWDLSKYAGEQDFPDDISAILFEFGGAKVNAD
ncbi:PP2C family protein-serine/threonine phosphatase [Actibacterium sp. 188UL27-1]|uniref:PP2C family protein-serine/threonine phosphatase n=1 Tax=Actibacterium sp. 188UL27-1 TaxID=2786961 RepID=UPI00195C52B0|nr:fused response regulator/phosphatase [Actibacterium sp. 188UL27-1]MBM7067064.1 SpoIIE family protein phosphatase [Actibacterium sp. 188UL27-1]